MPAQSLTTDNGPDGLRSMWTGPERRQEPHEQRRECSEDIRELFQRMNAHDKFRERVNGAGIVLGMLFLAMVYAFFDSMGSGKEALKRQGDNKATLARIEERLAVVVDDMRDMKQQIKDMRNAR